MKPSPLYGSIEKAITVDQSHIKFQGSELSRFQPLEIGLGLEMETYRQFQSMVIERPTTDLSRFQPLEIGLGLEMEE